MTLGLLLLTLIFVGVGAVWLTRAARRMRSIDGDGSAVVLASACHGLPADRVEWGRAMCTELACVDGRAARWRFALGGVWAAVSARLAGRVRRQPGVSVVVVGVLVCAGLAIAALASYPSLLAAPRLPLLVGVLVIVLVGYPLLAAAQVRDASPVRPGAVAAGLAAGAVLGAAWLVFAAAWWNLHGWPLIAAVVLPVLAGAYAARTAGGVGAGLRALTGAGLVAGLVAFVGFTIDSLVTARGPYDAGQLDDFHRSGYASLPAYAMGDSLAVAVLMLVLVPGLTLVVGGLGAIVGGARLRPTERIGR